MNQSMPQSELVSEAFLAQLELRRTQALVERNLAMLMEMHAPEYELVTPAGKVFSRQTYLAAIERGPFYAAWNIGEMRFRIAENMAIIRYLATLKFPSGKEVTCWHTDAYENRAGQWQAVWSQATEIKAPGTGPQTPRSDS